MRRLSLPLCDGDALHCIPWLRYVRMCAYRALHCVHTMHYIAPSQHALSSPGFCGLFHCSPCTAPSLSLASYCLLCLPLPTTLCLPLPVFRHRNEALHSSASSQLSSDHFTASLTVTVTINRLAPLCSSPTPLTSIPAWSRPLILIGFPLHSASPLVFDLQE